MSIRIETKHLIELLGTLAYTAESGILLHSARGYPTGGEPGKSDLLVGTSATGYSAGHTHVVAYGQLPRAVLWHMEDVDAVLSACRPRFKDNKEHAVEIDLTGDRVVVREDPDLFGDRGLEQSFQAGDLEDYPRGIWSLLTEEHLDPRIEDDNGLLLPRLPRVDYGAAYLAPFVTIAKHLKSPLEIFTYHQRLHCLIQIGHKYRGVIKPVAYSDDRARRLGEGPGGDVYPAKLPPKREVVVDLRTASGVLVGTTKSATEEAADG